MSQEKKKNFPLVEVRWVDSASTTGWQRYVELEPLTCWSAGYLVHKSARSVVVALNISSKESGHECGDYITIPRSAVKLIRRLK